LLDVQKAVEQYEAAVIANPVSLILTMREAHKALVKYAKSDRSPQNLAEVVAALETFKTHVEIVSSAVKTIY
jgi:hypothetical protein